MVLTLELPIRKNTAHPISAYENRFGSIPSWLDELPTTEARILVSSALRRGVPLTPADYLN